MSSFMRFSICATYCTLSLKVRADGALTPIYAESFLEAQQRMFDHFGGVPRRLIFDNGKVGVKEGFGLHAVAQD